MAIRKIARMGHDILKQVAPPVADPTAPLRIQDEVVAWARDRGVGSVRAIGALP